MIDFIFYVSVLAMYVTAMAAGMDPKLQSEPTLMMFVSLVFTLFVGVLYYIKGH